MAMTAEAGGAPCEQGHIQYVPYVRFSICKCQTPML